MPFPRSPPVNPAPPVAQTGYCRGQSTPTNRGQKRLTKTDRYALVSGDVTALFVSPGSGALTSLGGSQEAYATGVQVVVVVSQVPRLREALDSSRPVR